jgi:iron complex outermembrane receptor protein
MNKRLLLLTCAIGAFSGFAGAGAAYAADAPGQSASDVAEVVVTAEKREVSVQKVPVAVTAITAKERDTVGILTLQDMTNFTPGLTYTSTTDHLYVRGIGRQTIDLGADAGVPAYSDGFYNPDPVLIVLPPMFIGTTQVLRGPQGTLFGRNGIAGAIDVDSVRPTATPYGEGRLTVGNYNTYNGELAVSGPLAPGLKARLGGFFEEQNTGYFKDVAGGPSESGAIKTWYMEGSISADLGDNAQLYVHAFTFGNNSRGGPGARAGWDANPWGTSLTAVNNVAGANLSFNPAAAYDNPGNLTAISPGWAITDVIPGKSVILGNVGSNPAVANKYNFASGFPLQVLNRNTGDINYQFTYHFPAFDFKYIGGFQQYTYQTIQESQAFGYDTSVVSYQLPFSGDPTCSIAGGADCLTVSPQVTTNYTQSDAWWSHEFNLTSTGAGPLQWIGGVYVYSERYSNPVYADMSGQANVAAPIYLGVGPAPANPDRALYSSNYFMRETSGALYGQVDYKITDTVKLTGGLRYSSDHKFGTEYYRLVMFGGGTEYSSLAPALGAPTAGALTYEAPWLYGAGAPAVDLTPFLCTTATPPGASACHIGSNGQAIRSLNGSSSAVTGTAGVEWTPDSATLGYLRYSRGYKELGFNAGALASSPEVAPELVNDYEAGLKHTFGHNLVVDAAIFYEDYLNAQVPVTVLNAGVTQSNLLSISKSRSDGFELETVWTPIDRLQLLFSYAYDDTSILTNHQYLDTVNPNLGAQYVKGDPLPNAPKNKISLNGNYTFVFDPGSLSLSATYIWRDTQQGSIFGQSYWQSPSWSQLDLRAVWKDPKDRYEIVAYGRNVLNTTGYPSGPGAYDSGNAATPTVYTIYKEYTTNPPVTFGMEFHYKFL